MDRVTLDDILNNDPFNLLPDIKAKNPVVTADDRLVASFEEINSFYEKNGSEPQKSTDMNERCQVQPKYTPQRGANMYQLATKKSCTFS